MELAQFLRTDPDGTKIYEYEGVEITESELTDRMKRIHDRERLLEEWKADLEAGTDHGEYLSNEALRRLAERGFPNPTQEQLLKVLQEVRDEPPPATPETKEAS